MSNEQIIRAWKDPKFRATLSASLHSQFEHPSGEALVELEESELALIVGGNTSNSNCGCVSGQTSCGTICTFTGECPFLSICC
jgi:mersacidin/lichenicidin family type 2 lantibiotic